ncbi:MAG: VOC family protein [Micropruina glycogenica]|jgi:uncharacterized glyoxalase superfamily protein PhnB|nr:bleomycin resistance protein [Propionibacteriaceae bacterium]
MSTPQLYACLRYLDVDAVIPLLEALGFTERAIMRDPDDPRVVHHAQFRWREHGGIMFGTERDGGVGPKPGTACVNLVVPTDADVDRTLARALAAGARQISPVDEPPHGGRCVAVVDAEGNIFNIDSYQGE